nr:hypothetical protein [Tanacetum cinerariifolium]
MLYRDSSTDGSSTGDNDLIVFNREAKIHVRSKLHYFPVIKDRLNEAYRSLFRTTYFGSWLDITFDLPLIYNVNGHNLHFGRCEFFLVIGFKFGMELVSVVDDVLLRMVDNLDAWNTFPWDEHIWMQLYDFIRNVSSKHKLEHLDGLRKNPNHFPRYSYAPKSPPISIKGLYGEYLNKRSASHAAKQKDSGEFHIGLRGRHKGRETALIDRVRDLEGLCESLLTLPKEAKRLRGRIFKFEDIIQDFNGHVPSVFMPANPVSQPIYGDFSSNLAILNGFCNLSQNEDEKGDCEHYKYTYSSKQEDQIIRLADQRQQDDISKMKEEAERKIKSEIQRLYDHREAREKEVKWRVNERIVNGEER